MSMDELEPVAGPQIAGFYIAEMEEVCDTLRACPELASLPDWYDACIRYRMDLDALDSNV